MPLDIIKVGCRRCRIPFILHPGEPIRDLCSTCRRQLGTTFSQAIAANASYHFLKRLTNRSAETGKPLNPFERGATSLSLLGRGRR